MKYRNKIFIVFFLFVCAFAGAKAKRSLLSDTAKQLLDAALVKAPVDQEVCFSPSEPCDVKLIKFIQSARKSLDIAIYDITLDQLVHQVLVASKKINVRIIVDKRQSKGNHSLVSTLVRAGANVRFGKQRGIMHNKFTIVDDGMIETGSFNYSNNATRSNNENQIYLASPEIVRRYKQRFEELWAEASQVERSNAGL